MSVRSADDFIADIERQFDWYLTQAGWEVQRSLEALRLGRYFGGYFRKLALPLRDSYIRSDYGATQSIPSTDLGGVP